MTRKLLSVLLSCFTCAAAATARADIPPPDSCSNLGAVCSNAGQAFDQPGTCVSSTCTRAAPDGSVTYACLRCIPSNGTGGAAGTGGTTSSDAGTTDSGCGCALAGRPPSAPALLASFALLGLVLRRRRRLDD